MPDGLEIIVRPFQIPGAHGRAIIAATPKGTHEQATLTWGGQATLKDTVSARPSVNVVCCNEQINETSRDTETARVTSARDPRCYVMVRRARRIDFKKADHQSCFADGWEQMSGVASAVRGAFADLAADIKEVEDSISGRAPETSTIRWDLDSNTRQGGLVVDAFASSGTPYEEPLPP